MTDRVGGRKRVPREERKENVLAWLKYYAECAPEKTWKSSDVAKMTGIGNGSYLREILFDLWAEDEIEAIEEPFASQSGYLYRWYARSNQ